MASAAPIHALHRPVAGSDDVEFPTPRKAIWRQGQTYSPGDVLRCKNNRPCKKPRLAEGATAEPESDEENLS